VSNHSEKMQVNIYTSIMVNKPIHALYWGVTPVYDLFAPCFGSSWVIIKEYEFIIRSSSSKDTCNIVDIVSISPCD
jgi:hypothetical protein